MLKVNARESGNLLRRCIHIGMAIIPVLYYGFDKLPLLHSAYFTREKILSLLVLICLCLEAVRLRLGWRVYGQRAYEARQISAVAWTVFSIGLVLLLAPKTGFQGAAYGAPIIWSLCLGDPLLGEMRLRGVPSPWVLITAALVIGLIWSGCAWQLGTPLFLLPLMTPLIIAAEWFCPPFMDDNAAMLLAPLVVVIYLSPWLAAR